MEDTERIHALLEEIRDLQKQHLDEYREQAARSVQLSEEAVRRQASIGSLYRKTVFAGAVVLVGLFAWLWWVSV